MSKLFKFICFIFACNTLILSSCKKYPEGPNISFESKKARVANDWSFSSVIENEIDKTSDYNEAVLTLTKTGVLNFKYVRVDNNKKTTYEETGYWFFESNKSRLKFIFNNGVTTYEKYYDILELRRNEMHLYSDDKTENWVLVSQYLR